MKITYTATAPNGEQFSRTSGTMSYTTVLMVADKGGDNWGPWSWHTSPANALKAANSQHLRETANIKLIETEITNVTGKADARWIEANPEEYARLSSLKERFAAERKAAKADAKAAKAEAEAGIEAAIGEWVAEPTVEAVAEVSKAVEVAEVEAEVVEDYQAEHPAEVEAAVEAMKALSGVIKAEAEKKAPKKAKAAKKAPAVPTDRALKQQLGSAVVAAMTAAVEENLPEGMDLTDAYAIVTKWASYIPVVKEA